MTPDKEMAKSPTPKASKLPEDPIEKVLLYRRYVLQFPMAPRLGVVGWSATLVLLAAPGLRTRIWRTGVTAGLLGLLLTPDLLKSTRT